MIKSKKPLQRFMKSGYVKSAFPHCTGFDASMRLAREFGDDFFINNAGNVYEPETAAI